MTASTLVNTMRLLAALLALSAVNVLPAAAAYEGGCCGGQSLPTLKAVNAYDVYTGDRVNGSLDVVVFKTLDLTVAVGFSSLESRRMFQGLSADQRTIWAKAAKEGKILKDGKLVDPRAKPKGT